MPLHDSAMPFDGDRPLAELRPLPGVPFSDMENSHNSFARVVKIPQPSLGRIEVEGPTREMFKQVIKIPIRREQSIRIGSDTKKCNVRIKNAAVSPVHCEIYSVVFEDGDELLPLIYIRDCQSATGTFVNDHNIGQGLSATTATLLEDNDAISVGPCTLRLRGCVAQGGSTALTRVQREEVLLFEDQYMLKDTVLGHGAFATVYLAVDVRTKQQVICKVHDLEGLGNLDPLAVQRVEQEVSIWSHLDHKNIIAFRRAFRTKRSMFTFAELAAGGDLFALIQREKTLAELEIKWIIKQILEAVVYLHCKGVAHRDIKPENVLCMSSPLATPRIALTDFGCSGVTSRGRMKTATGTDTYRAPEVRQADGGHGVAVDIWAIGVLMLQLLSGDDPVEMPDQLADMSEVEQYVWSVHFERVATGHEAISEAGLNFLLACLNLDPAKRPSAMRASRHEWLYGHEPDRTIFRERQQHQLWKPRDILIPTVVDLRWADDCCILDSDADNREVCMEKANDLEDKDLEDVKEINETGMDKQVPTDPSQALNQYMPALDHVGKRCQTVASVKFCDQPMHRNMSVP